MAEFNSPSEIAREVLRRLATRRIQPTPENFRELYQQIAGTQSEDPFPEKQLRQIAAALPRATPEQLRLARQFEASYAEHSWASFRHNMIELMSASQEEHPSWGSLIRDLVTQLERRQMGLNSITKQEALNRVLESGNGDPALFFNRLNGLVKGWSQLPAAQGNIDVADGNDNTVPADTGIAVPPVASPPAIASAPELWRELLASALESAIGALLIDTPDLAREASDLARMLRQPDAATAEEFQERLHKFAYRVQWIAQDQSYIRSALLNLLRLIVENIGELVIEDKFLQGQMTVLMDLFARPLDKGVLEELGERLRDVIYKQGTLKRNLSEAQQRLRDMLAHFVEQLAELAESTGAYHGKVSQFAEQISKASSLQELAGYVDDIMKETKQVERSARHSQQELHQLRITVDQAHKEIARLENELEQASTLVRHDPLTGALNRKGLDEMLARETARMQRRNSRLCLSLLDIDDFKKLNDTLGHATGDEALKHLTQVVRENIRPQDSAGRYGGEEFLILLPDTTLEEAELTMRRLQRELTKRIFLHDNQKVLITFSAGVTEMLRDEPSQAAVDRADKAMYRAKKAGKNRVERG